MYSALSFRYAQPIVNPDYKKI